MAAQRKRVPLSNWSRQKDLIPPVGDGPCGPGSDAEEASATSKYLLEMARTFSLERQSEPVLCARLLQGVDLLVSADTWSPTSLTSEAIHGRFEEVMDAVHGRRDPLRIRHDWSAAVLSFGLVRWWPSWMRHRIAHSLGPFKVVIDCQTPSAQMESVVWLADGDVNTRRSASDGAAW